MAGFHGVLVPSGDGFISTPAVRGSGSWFDESLERVLD